MDINCTQQRYFSVLFLIALFFSTTLICAQEIERTEYDELIEQGVKHLEKREFEAAQQIFTTALEINRKLTEAHFGLGLIYFHIRQDNNAEKKFSEVLKIDPRHTSANNLLGELFYRQENYEKAILYMEKAVQTNLFDFSLRQRLERMKREFKTEKDFNQNTVSHFQLKHEGYERVQASRIVLKILEDAYGEIGRALSYYPAHDVQAILYSNEQFQEVTEAPGWSGGVFDGKIRIPIRGIEEETPGLRYLLFHEYTHALVYSITPICPTWLNEGLAQYFEKRKIGPGYHELLKGLAKAENLPSLRALEGPFAGLSGDQVFIAYLTSFSVVRYLIDRHSLYSVKSILEKLAQGATIQKVIDQELMISFDKFELNWRHSLE